MTQYYIGRDTEYTSLDFPTCDIFGADKTIDAYDQVKQLFSSIIMEVKTDSSSLNEYSFIFPTATSIYSLNFLKQIHVEDIPRLNNFLNEHKDIVYDVLLGCQIATEVFDKKTHFNLAVENDEEMDLNYLVLSVQLKNFDPIILEKIDTITSSYSEDIKDKSTYFIVTADFH